MKPLFTDRTKRNTCQELWGRLNDVGIVRVTHCNMRCDFLPPTHLSALQIHSTVLLEINGYVGFTNSLDLLDIINMPE